MGKFILCSGSRADTPYLIEETGYHIYTVEELCFYLYHNIYLITSDFFNYELISWLDKETKMSGLAAKLTSYKASRATLKDYVVAILCSTDYYEEKEIKDLIAVIDQIEGLPFIKRRKLRADKYLDYGRYRMAAQEYNNIMESREASILTPVEYGNLLHNFAIALLRVGTFREAAAKLEEAYKLNQNPETLKLYLVVLKLLGSEKEYEERLAMMDIPLDAAQEAFNQFEQWKQEAESSPSYHLYEELSGFKEDKDTVRLFQEVEKVLAQWTSDYRRKIS